ncbi:hypothetical protein KCP77_10310 [Salmonella enterica subsp. enterica]|nr:hypothetical protein KCP77_10310 [Salmonella enterica subsp. enterica]
MIGDFIADHAVRFYAPDPWWQTQRRRASTSSLMAGAKLVIQPLFAGCRFRRPSHGVAKYNAGIQHGR